MTFGALLEMSLLQPSGNVDHCWSLLRIRSFHIGLTSKKSTEDQQSSTSSFMSMCTRVMTLSIQLKSPLEVVITKLMLPQTHMLWRKSIHHTRKQIIVNVLLLLTVQLPTRHHLLTTMPVLSHVYLQLDVRHLRSTRFHIHANSSRVIVLARRN